MPEVPVQGQARKSVPELPATDVSRADLSIALDAVDRGLAELPDGWPLDEPARFAWAAAELEKIRQIAAQDAQVARWLARRRVPAQPSQMADDALQGLLGAREGVLRVGFACFGMDHPGGIEDWIRAITATAIRGVHWAGVYTSNYPTPSWRPPTASLLIGDEGFRFLDHASDLIVSSGLPRGKLAGFRTPVIVVSHGSGIWTERMFADAHEWAAGLAAVSEAAAGVFAEPATVLHNGVDPERVRPRAERLALREAWGIGPDEVAVAYYGRLSQEKEPAAVCRATAALGDGYRPLVIGDGHQADELRRQARQLDPRVVVLEAVDVPGDVFPGLDVFLLASPSEGFSLSTIEAWLAGLACVCTPVGAIPEIEDRHGQMVHRTNGGDDLAAAVAAAARDQTVRRYAQQVALQEFTREAMVKRWVRYLLEFPR